MLRSPLKVACVSLFRPKSCLLTTLLTILREGLGKTKKLKKTKKSRTSEELMGGQSEEATKKVSFDWMRTGPDYFSHFVFSVNIRKHCSIILLSHV